MANQNTVSSKEEARRGQKKFNEKMQEKPYKSVEISQNMYVTILKINGLYESRNLSI